MMLRSVDRLHVSCVFCAMALCAALALACGAPAPPEGDAGAAGAPAEEAVIEAHDALIDAFETGDLEGFVALLDPSPGLLIFHPTIEERFGGIDEVREGLSRMFSQIGEAEWSLYHPAVSVVGDVAWITSHVVVEAAGLEAPFVGRGTEIWVRRGGSWRLIHGHWSESPDDSLERSPE